MCNRGQARYRTELAMEESYPLDNGFVAAACDLPSTYDEPSYMKFLDKWGTVTTVVLERSYNSSHQSSIIYGNGGLGGTGEDWRGPFL